VSRNLLLILQGHVQERRLGTIYYALIDVLLADTSIVQPDLIFVAAGRESIITRARDRRAAGSGGRDSLPVVSAS